MIPTFAAEEGKPGNYDSQKLRRYGHHLRMHQRTTKEESALKTVLCGADFAVHEC